jgi:hypothetical protein
METQSEREERELDSQIRYYERQADLWERQRDTALRLGGRWPGENPHLIKLQQLKRADRTG